VANARVLYPFSLFFPYPNPQVLFLVFEEPLEPQVNGGGQGVRCDSTFVVIDDPPGFPERRGASLFFFFLALLNLVLTKVPSLDPDGAINQFLKKGDTVDAKLNLMSLKLFVMPFPLAPPVFPQPPAHESPVT